MKFAILLLALAILIGQSIAAETKIAPNRLALTENFGGQLKGITAGTSTGDAANMGQLWAKINKSGDTMSGALAMGGYKIGNMMNGTADQDAVSYSQLHNVTSGFVTVGNNDSSADFNTADYASDNACIDAALVRGSVFIKRGVYHFVNPVSVPDDRIVTGDFPVIHVDKAGSYAWGDGGYPAISDDIDDFICAFVNSDTQLGNHNITITNLVINGEKDNKGNEWTPCLDFYGVENLVVSNCRLYNARGDGISINSAGFCGSTNPSRNIVVVNNNISDNTRNSVSILNTVGGYVLYNTMSNGRCGVDIEAEYNYGIKCAFNSISGMNEYGIVLYVPDDAAPCFTRYVTISDNEINNTIHDSAGTYAVGISIERVDPTDTLTNISCTRNVISHVVGSTGLNSYGIRISNVNECDVKLNTVSDVEWVGIEIGSCHNTTVVDNDVSFCNIGINDDASFDSVLASNVVSRSVMGLADYASSNPFWSDNKAIMCTTPFVSGGGSTGVLMVDNYYLNATGWHESLP